MRKNKIARNRIAGIAMAAALVTGVGAVAVVNAAPVLAQEVETESLNPFQAFIQSLIDDEVISQDQADTIAERAAEARVDRGQRGNRGAKSAVAAEAIGITGEELRTALQEGATIADVATDNGVDVQAVVDAMIADRQEKLDQAVADGRLTADEAAEKAAEIAEHVEDVVNGEVPEGFGEGRRQARGGPGQRGPGLGGPGLGGPGAATDTATDA